MKHGELEWQFIEQVIGLPFAVRDVERSPMPDPGELHLVIDARLEGAEEEESDDMEWAAIPLLYTLAAFSFHDARPRGYSANEFEPEDMLTVGQFLPLVEFRAEGLRWYGDYLAGRRMKTTLVVRPEGSFRIETLARGEAALRWLDRLRGKETLRVVK